MVPFIRPGPVDVANGVEWAHPDNRGLACLLASPTGTGGGAGGVQRDLTGKTPGAALTGTAWAGTPYGPGLTFAGAGAATVGGLVGGLLPTGTKVVSVALWFRPTGSLTAYESLFDSGTNGAGRYLSAFLGGTASGLYAGVAGCGANPIVLNRPLKLNAWQRLALTSDGTTLAAYLDGAFAGSGTGSGYIGGGFNPSPWVVGGNPSTGAAIYNGSVADVRVWSVCLTPAAVARDYDWSRDPQTDARLRRTSTRSLFVTAAGTPAAAFVPASAPGWGW